MSVLEIRIRGFKSYQDLVVLKLSPETNVIVGRNGCGKSNVYDAIQFVVSNKYASLRRDIRRRLLHEGTSSASSAFVELIFDNSDGRFPIDTDQVSLKRVIGLKKDEYLLNNKHVSRSDVDSLLETAGFSKTNPYNIVQQGKVATLIKMKPEERLDLCKEIAGTRIYEDRRKESIKILRDSEVREEAVQEILKSLTDNLEHLSGEREELLKFQKLDLERRSIEYALFDKELHESNEELLELDDRRAELSNSSDTVNNELVSIQDERMEFVRKIEAMQESLEAEEREKKSIMTRLDEFIKHRAALESELQELTENTLDGKKKQLSNEKETELLVQEIKVVESKIQKSTPRFTELSSLQSELSVELRTSEQRLRELYSKQDRKNRFRTRQERDEYLNGEIGLRTKTLEEEAQQIQRCVEDIKKMEEQLEKSGPLREEKRIELSKLEAEWNSLGEKERSLLSQRDVKMEERKECWKRIKLSNVKNEEYLNSFNECKRLLYQGLPTNLRKGIQAIEDLVSSKGLEGVYGPLINLLEDYEGFDSFFKCIETTAGKRLFHIVVEDDEIASRLLAYLSQNGYGRITIIPMNRTAPLNISYPSSKDAFPMMDRLKFPQRFANVFQQIFGKTLITRDLATASLISRKYSLDTITLDGDQSSSRGVLSGGYVDSRSSRLKVLRKFRKLEKKVKDIDSDSTTLQELSTQLDQEITYILGKLQKTVVQRKASKRNINRLEDELESLEREHETGKNNLKDRVVVLKELKDNSEFTSRAIESLKNELKVDLSDSLDSSELKEMDSLNTKVSDLRKELLSVSSEKSVLESELCALEKRLELSLAPRLRKLSRATNNVSRRELQEDQERLEDQLATVQNSMESLNEELERLEANRDKHSAEILSGKNHIESLGIKEQSLRKQIREKSKSLDKLLNAHSLTVHKKNKCMKNIRELGSLPQESYSQYRDSDTHELLVALEGLSGQLRQFEHINKKAIEQYIRSTKRQASLSEGVEEVRKGKRCIQELIEHLDRQKQADIQRTFETISENFVSVFSELVHDGKAELVILSEGEGEDKVFSGVDIKVQFSGQREALSMKQLSGGQQTIVALSLIFAIQRCDPSPFYLFDEIDSNLDAVYRTAVAQMIQSQAKQSQFICTTFRPEILPIAEKCFGVSYENKVSQVHPIQNEDALALIMEVEREDRS